MGVDDILNTEESVNGVFFIDEKFSNGYHLYIPYGIHNDLHSTIRHSISLIEKEINEKKQFLEQLSGEQYEALIADTKFLIEKLKTHVKVLQALNELEYDI